MLTIEDLKAAQKAAEAAEIDYKNLLWEWANQQCPFSAGDIVEVVGYSHNGKKMQVERISGKCWGDEFQWVVHGNVIKSNGTPGKQEASFDSEQYESSMLDCANNHARRGA